MCLSSAIHNKSCLSSTILMKKCVCQVNLLVKTYLSSEIRENIPVCQSNLYHLLSVKVNTTGICSVKCITGIYSYSVKFNSLVNSSVKWNGLKFCQLKWSSVCQVRVSQRKLLPSLTLSIYWWYCDINI